MIPKVGRKVRITAPSLGLRRSVGILRGVDDQNLLVEFSLTQPPVHVATDEVRTLEVSSGRESHLRTDFSL